MLLSPINHLIKKYLMNHFTHLLIALLITSGLNNELLSQIRVKAVGDIMLGSVTPDPIIPLNNGRIFADSISKELDGADITMGNLEGVFINSSFQPKKCSKESREAGRCYEFGMPRTIAPVLKKMHFNVLGMDNNHVWDYGSEGYELTKKILHEYGIEQVPHKSHTTITIKDKHIAIVAFGFSDRSYHISDLQKVKEVIKEIDNDHHIVIATFHGGAEGKNFRRQYNMKEEFFGEDRGNLMAFSKVAIDAGADMIIGHGPHVLRGIQLYKNKLICYSLGNFITYGNMKISGYNGLGAIMDITLDENNGNFIKGKIIPTKQKPHGIAFRDRSNRSIQVIKELMELDFPNTPLIIKNDGTIIKKQS